MYSPALGHIPRCVEDVSRLCGVPRRALHLTATAKGLVGGALRYTTREGTTVDASLSPTGVIIPDSSWGITDVISPAK